MYVAACWAYSKLDLVGGTIYLREREKGTGWIGRMAFTWLFDDLPLLLFQVYFVIQYHGLKRDAPGCSRRLDPIDMDFNKQFLEEAISCKN